MPMKITCIRHGKPDFNPPSLTSRIEPEHFNSLLDEYDAAGLEPVWNGKRKGEELRCRVISSDLPRALDTARLLSSNGRKIPMDPIFREVPLPRFRPGGMRVQPHLFMFWSRIGWALGILKSQESKAQANQRVEKAADLLEELCREHQEIALCSHGYFLMLLGRELRRRGWKTRKRGLYRFLERAEFTRR